MLWDDPVQTVSNAVALSLVMPTMMPDQIEDESDERVQALLNKIDEAKIKTKTYGVIPILREFERLREVFQQKHRWMLEP